MVLYCFLLVEGDERSRSAVDFKFRSNIRKRMELKN